MTKRKKNGLGIFEEEKADEYGSSPTLMETGVTTEDVPEASNCANQQQPQQVSLAKNRVHVTRTAAKETQVSESTEAESGSASTEKCQKNSLVQRGGNRGQKRIRKDIISSETAVKKVVALKQNAPLRSKTTRRPWELWSVEDKNSFFEALCEYGKDFENIQSYIAQKSKKKGIPSNMIKNKDQVRHFYYRTWHKISKYLDISDDVRKQTQEIYGLVNYAELRKKIGGCLNEKNRQKLNELVFNGVTTVKYKGKKLRIKTPVCRALKKLNNVAEPKEPEVEKLPKDIVLELHPHTNEAWIYVQNLAQNPRVRTRVSLQRRLKTVIEYLQQKWKPYRLRRKEHILACLSQAGTDVLIPKSDDPAPMLRVKPRSDASISALSISAMDSASSSDVCLEKYIKISRENILDKDITKAKKSRLKPKLQTDCDRCDQNAVNRTSESASEGLAKEGDKTAADDSYNINLLTPPKSVEEADDFSENVIDEAQRSLSLLSSMLSHVDRESPPPQENTTDKENFTESSSEEQVESPSEENSDPVVAGPSECSTIEEMYFNTCPEGKNLTLGQLLSLKSEEQMALQDAEQMRTEISGDDAPAAAETLKENSENPSSKSVEAAKDLDSLKESIDEPSAETLKNGWTLENVGLLTIGELYLMLGQPSKILLEYEFEQLVDKPCEVREEAQVSGFTLAEVLRKLISVAASTFAEFKSKQTPLSPTSRNSSSARVSSSSQVSKAAAKCIAKSTSLKTAVKTKSASSVCTKSVLDAVVPSSSTDSLVKKDSKLSSNEVCSTTNSLGTVCSDGMPSSSSEKHVFVVPVGTAPRTMKKPTQASLREEIDKLLPGNRRGCRVRRKPLVVQRPLLPRDGTCSVSGPRPMTVVHLVPSGSQLTAVIPSSCATSTENKSAMPAKKVVKILSTGPAIGVRPLQVPLMKPVAADSNQNVILQPSAISATQLMVSPGTSQGVQGPDPQAVALAPSIGAASNTSAILSSIDKSPVMAASCSDIQAKTAEASELSSPHQKKHILSTTSECVIGVKDKVIASSSSPPQISIPEPSCSSSSLSPGDVPPFIEISLAGKRLGNLFYLGLASKGMAEQNDGNLLDFSDNSALSALELTPPKASSPSDLPSHTSDPVATSPSSENTPPQSPPSRPFRIESPGPEAQWLNGESGELSLNTFLNTLESPCKVLPISSSAPSVNLNSENSNLDPITRLAPVVDSQVRCLLEECSVDFIAKFEDLADVINSSNNDSKQA